MTTSIGGTKTDTPAVTILPPLPEPNQIDEINHRVANSLQLLAAMVSVETRVIKDPEARSILGVIQRRIGAIGRVHRQLCDAREASDVNLGAYLETLAQDLEEGWPDTAGKRRVFVHASDILISHEEATAIGIVVSELVANAFKHAYAPGMPGDVWIGLVPLWTGGYRLEVVDRGYGPDVSASQDGTGLGRRLVDMIARRLEARHAWRDAFPGTRFTLEARGK
jgi:two-component sensor histidine kinase